MNLLAIDTSSVACSVALECGDNFYERHEEQAREHTRLLMPMIREVLDEAGIKSGEIDSIVLGNGPGSFIGMRIAASVAQGLAHGANVNIVPVSSLAAVAAQVFAESDAREVIVTQDAHMNEVYLGAFRRGDDGLPEPLFPERLHAQTPIEELDESTAGSRVAAGYGWQHYPHLATVNEDLIGNMSAVLYPTARYLLALGKAGLESDLAVAPQDVVPAYLRHKVAEKPRGKGP